VRTPAVESGENSPHSTKNSFAYRKGIHDSELVFDNKAILHILTIERFKGFI